MNNDKAELLEILQHNRECTPVGAIRAKTRCMLCGDSKRDLNKKRFYIICDPMTQDAVKYICFNCGEYGMLTADMLSQALGGATQDELALLRRINKTAMYDSGNKRVNKYKNNREIDIVIPPARKTQHTIRKIKYMNERIGYRVPIEDYGKLKLVFSIMELLSINHIPVMEKYKPFIPLYERDYIGWLSVKNEYLILRDITGQHEFRYIKFNLFGMDSNAHSFYTISNGINTITQQDIRIIAAEGPFDIMSITYNMYGGILPDCLLMSTNHGAFYNPLLHYINKGLVGSNVFIDIYRDSDSIMDYQLLKNQMKIYTRNFSVYRNALGKDFGVPREEFDIEREI